MDTPLKTEAEKKETEQKSPLAPLRTIAPLQILQSITARYIPKEEKMEKSKQWKWKNYLDEKRSIIFKTKKLHKNQLRDWKIFTEVDFVTQTQPIEFDGDNKGDTCYVLYFRSFFPIWVEIPWCHEWVALQSACFCYWSDAKEKCDQHFLKYIFQRALFSEVVDIYLWNREEWNKNEYTLRRDVYIKLNRLADPYHSDATFRSENHAMLSAEGAQRGMKRAIASYLNSQKKLKVGMSELDSTIITKSKTKKFGKKL